MVTSASDGGSCDTAASGGCTVKLLDCLLEGTFGRLHRGLFYPATASGGGGQEQHEDQEPVHVTVKTIAGEGELQTSLLLYLLVGAPSNSGKTILKFISLQNHAILIFVSASQRT